MPKSIIQRKPIREKDSLTVLVEATDKKIAHLCGSGHKIISVNYFTTPSSENSPAEYVSIITYGR